MGVWRVMANARAESDLKPKKKSAPRKTSKGVGDDISSSKPAIGRSFEGCFFGILSPRKANGE